MLRYSAPDVVVARLVAVTLKAGPRCSISVAARRAGTGRRPHAPRERLRLRQTQCRAAPGGRRLETKYGNSNHARRTRRTRTKKGDPGGEAGSARVVPVL